MFAFIHLMTYKILAMLKISFECFTYYICQSVYIIQHIQHLRSFCDISRMLIINFVLAKFFLMKWKCYECAYARISANYSIKQLLKHLFHVNLTMNDVSSNVSRECFNRSCFFFGFMVWYFNLKIIAYIDVEDLVEQRLKQDPNWGTFIIHIQIRIGMLTTH